MISLVEVRDWDDLYNGYNEYPNLDDLDENLKSNTPAYYRSSVMNQLKRGGRAIVTLGKRNDGGIDYDLFVIE